MKQVGAYRKIVDLVLADRKARRKRCGRREDRVERAENWLLLWK